MALTPTMAQTENRVRNLVTSGVAGGQKEGVIRYLQNKLADLTMRGDVGSPEYIVVAGQIQAIKDADAKAQMAPPNDRSVISDLLPAPLTPTPPMMPQGVAQGAPQGVAPEMTVLPEDAGGLAAMEAPNMEGVATMAGGGLVAFADGGEVPRFQNAGLVQASLPFVEDEERLRAERIRGARPGPGVSFAQAFPDAAKSASRAPFSKLGMMGRLALGPIGMLESLTSPSEDDMTRLREFDRAKATLKDAGFSDKDIDALKTPDVYRVAAEHGYKPAIDKAGVEAILAQAQRGEGPNVSRNTTINPNIPLPVREPAADATKKEAPADAGGLGTIAKTQGLDMESTFEKAQKFVGDKLAALGDPFKDIREEMKTASDERKAELKNSAWMRLAEFGFGMAAGTSPYALANIGKAGVEALKGFADDLREKKKLDRDDRKMLAEFKRLEHADKRGNVLKTAEIGMQLLNDMSANQRAELNNSVQLKIASQQLQGQKMEREAARFESQKSTALRQAEAAVAKAIAKNFALANDPTAQENLLSKYYNQFLEELMKPKDQVGQSTQKATGTTLRFDAKGNPIQ